MITPKKNILIITYYWPPAGGPGVQRWLKFVKYLPDFGFNPIIYTPENPNYPIVDETLLNDVPKGIDILRTKIWEPYQLAEKLNKSNKKFKAGQFDIGKNQSWKSKVSIWIRGNFFIPDARRFWVKPSTSFLTKYLKENNIEVLVTTGPPHSLHLIGLNLKKKFPTLKWIADFRDPWTEISYYKHLKLTRWADNIHHRMEKEVFKTADVTLATSYTDAENFRKAGANSFCITNGFDEADTKALAQPTASEHFTLSYIGVLEQLRNPEILWNVIEKINKENPEFAKLFKLKFVGRLDDTILKRLENSNIKTQLINKGYVPHNEALQEMLDSEVLLITNFPNESSKGIIPGKIFEYLAAKKKILSFGPQEADVSRILEETNMGHHFTYDAKEQVKAFILEEFERWKNKENRGDASNILQFSRRELTHQLSELIRSKLL